MIFIFIFTFSGLWLFFYTQWYLLQGDQTPGEEEGVAVYMGPIQPTVQMCCQDAQAKVQYLLSNRKCNSKGDGEHICTVLFAYLPSPGNQDIWLKLAGRHWITKVTVLLSHGTCCHTITRVKHLNTDIHLVWKHPRASITVILQRIKLVNCINPHATTNPLLRIRFFHLIYYL